MCCQSTFPNGICVHLRTAFLIIFNSKLVELPTTILMFVFRRKKLFVVRRKIQCLYHRIAFPTTMNLIYVNLRTAFLKFINSMLVEFPSTIFRYATSFTVSYVSLPKKKEWKWFTIPGNTCITWSNLSGEQWLHHDHCWQSILVFCRIAFPTTTCRLSIPYTVSECRCARS